MDNSILESLLPRCPKDKMADFFMQVCEYADEQCKKEAEQDSIRQIGFC